MWDRPVQENVGEQYDLDHLYPDVRPAAAYPVY